MTAAPTSPIPATNNHRSVTYNPATYTITAGDQSLRVDTVFQSLVRRETFDEATIEHTIAAFYASLRYVPVYIYAAPVSPAQSHQPTLSPAATTPTATTPTDNLTYHPLMHVVVDTTRLSIVSPETFHHAIVAYLTAAGYTVTVPQSSP